MLVNFNYNHFHRSVLLTTLAVTLSWMTELTFLFSDNGLIDQPTYFTSFQYGPTIFAFNSAPYFIITCYIILLLSIIGNYFKYFTIISGLITYILFISFLNRNLLINYGGSDVLRILLCFNIIFNLTDKIKNLDISNAVKKLNSYLFRLQFALIYFSSFLHKFLSKEWQDGDAMKNILNNFNFNYFNFCWINDFPFLSLVLTKMTLLIELILPFFLINKYTLPLGISIAILFHIGIALFMNVHYFTIVMIIGLLACNLENNKSKS